MLCSMGSGAVAKGVCRSYHPGEQETFCPGRGEPQVHAYLPWLSEEDRALDGKSPITAVPVPWSLHSAAPLCCLHTSFCAESGQLNSPLPPHGVLHALCWVQGTGHDGYPCPATRILTESWHCGHQAQEPSASSSFAGEEPC